MLSWQSKNQRSEIHWQRITPTRCLYMDYNFLLLVHFFKLQWLGLCFCWFSSPCYKSTLSVLKGFYFHTHTHKQSYKITNKARLGRIDIFFFFEVVWRKFLRNNKQKAISWFLFSVFIQDLGSFGCYLDKCSCYISESFK